MDLREEELPQFTQTITQSGLKQSHGGFGDLLFQKAAFMLSSREAPKNLSPVALLTSIPSHIDKLQVTVLQLKKKMR